MSGAIQVVNKYKHVPSNADIYIGRGSVFGNPFPIKDNDTRDVVCDKYESLIRKEWKDALKGNVSPRIQAINELSYRVRNGERITLVCFCSPKRCHGDFIKRVVEWYATV